MAELSKPLISLRSLSRRAPELRQDVLVTHDHRIIGEFNPTPRAAQDDEDRARMGADPVDASEVPGAPGRLSAPEPATRGEPDGVDLARRARSGARRGGKP